MESSFAQTPPITPPTVVTAKTLDTFFRLFWICTLGAIPLIFIGLGELLSGGILAETGNTVALVFGGRGGIILLAHQGEIVVAPRRRLFPKRWRRDDAKPLRGKIIYLRRTDGSGRIRFLERNFLVSEHWINRLVRAEVDWDKEKVRFYGLRRADWKSQRLLKTMKFRLSKKTASD